ncbi:MAG: hypothetical protein AAFX79_05395 [Planctomycetota bacterium]
MRFRVRGIDMDSGEPIERIVEAPSKAEALGGLAEARIAVEDLREDGPPAPRPAQQHASAFPAPPASPPAAPADERILVRLESLDRQLVDLDRRLESIEGSTAGTHKRLGLWRWVWILTLGIGLGMSIAMVVGLIVTIATMAIAGSYLGDLLGGGSVGGGAGQPSSSDLGVLLQQIEQLRGETERAINDPLGGG